MKKNITLTVLGWLFASLFGQDLFAQNERIEKEEVIIQKKGDSPIQKETQEIIIRKKGDKDTKITLDISGGKVLINGKPMAEFSEDGITINNRKMIIRDGSKITMDFNDDRTRMLDDKTRMNDDRARMNDDLEGLEGMDFNNFGEGEKTKSFLGVGTEKDKDGAKITMVEKGSPAEKAGLQKDDIIYKVDDKKIDGMQALSETISTIKVGDEVKVYFLRDGKKKDVKATLAARKNSSAINRIYRFEMPNGKSRSFSFPTPPTPPTPPQFDMNGNFDFGEVFADASRPKLGIKIQDTEDGNGVKILEVEQGSASATAGLLKDDIVTEIGGVKVKNTDDAREQLHENADKSTYTMKAKRNGKEMDFSIKIPKKLKTAEL
jgi:serine protease Do